MNYDRTIRQLEQTFDDEKAYLLRGDLARLNRLADKKERLLLSLQTAVLSEGTIARFAQLAERNQALIKAAQEGVQSVRVRLAEIQRGAPVETYSRSGEKSEFAKPIRTLHRRA